MRRTSLELGTVIQRYCWQMRGASTGGCLSTQTPSPGWWGGGGPACHRGQPVTESKTQEQRAQGQGDATPRKPAQNGPHRSVQRTQGHSDQ